MRSLLLALATLLVPAAPAHAQGAASHPAVGVYAFADGREAYVEYLPDIDGLALMEFPSGRIRPLRPDGNRFTFGPSIGAAEPVAAVLAPDGDRLRWTENGATRTGRRVVFRSESASISSGAVTLAGTLTLPRGRGRFPAVVLLHGGGAQTRDFFWVTHFFARRGFAVLAYDKRGVGGSTGDWRTATFRDLAGDALAAVDWLRARSDIRADRIGLYGSSAGGWTAPFAAAAAPDRIAFVIVRSGSYLMERQNVVHEVEGDMRSAGYGDADVARMRALHALAMAARDEESWERLRAALAEMQSAPWAELTRLPRSLVAWASPGREADILDFVASQHRTNFDVLSTWAQLDMPVLYQVGERDRYVPGPESAARIAAALAHNPHALARVYPRGDHPMFESETGYPRDIGNVTRYAEGYLPDLDRFVRDQARPTR